jgi:predicted pyridoxine 5'-phosphate oxidase superfamily flavin-nucleotide-binding protein
LIENKNIKDSLVKARNFHKKAIETERKAAKQKAREIIAREIVLVKKTFDTELFRIAFETAKIKDKNIGLTKKITKLRNMLISQET